MAKIVCREKKYVIVQYVHVLNMDILLDVLPTTLQSVLIIFHVH